MRRPALALGLVLCALPLSLPASAQDRPHLRVRDAAGEVAIPLTTERGFAALPARVLERLGWTEASSGGEVAWSGPDGARLTLHGAAPFVRWDGALLQLADAPWGEGDALHVPLQLLTDFLPWKLPGLYAWEAEGMVLTSSVSGAGVAPVSAPPAEPLPEPVASPSSAVGETSPAPPSAALRAPRLVVIDPGHGGEDPGTIARSGVREKNVALGVALAMAEELRGREGIEVILIRSDDTFVPPWDRGARATELKGERYGIFVSIHANSAPASSNARGFETYFLSEARTEHERRVAAIENAPLGVQAPEEGGGDLDFILRELKNLDQQHWSSLLAEFVQGELQGVHAGPNRGVKQAPLAVLTNAIMPAVLVELGYLSHPEEARLLSQANFQRDAGGAIARAVVRFFERYPPGAGGGVGEAR